MYMSAEKPMTPAEIAADYNLPLAAVEEAIAYCQTDPPEIREDFEREERIMEATGMNDPAYKYGGKYRILSPQERARLVYEDFFGRRPGLGAVGQAAAKCRARHCHARGGRDSRASRRRAVNLRDP
jgi:hypothetical protein